MDIQVKTDFFIPILKCSFFKTINVSVNREMRPRNGRIQQLGRRFVFYSLYAWCVPFIIVIVGQILDNVNDPIPNIIKPGFGEMKCWFSSEYNVKQLLFKSDSNK